LPLPPIERLRALLCFLFLLVCRCRFLTVGSRGFSPQAAADRACDPLRLRGRSCHRRRRTTHSRKCRRGGGHSVLRPGQWRLCTGRRRRRGTVHLV